VHRRDGQEAYNSFVGTNSQVGAARDAHGLGAQAQSSREPSPESASQLEIGDALRESEARLQALLGSLDDLAFELDRDGVYLGVWTARAELLVAPSGQLLGHSTRQMLGDELGGTIVNAIRRALSSGTSESIEYSLDLPSGTRWFQARITPIVGQREPQTVCLLVRDITETRMAEQARHRAEARLRHAATHDSLTGLLNRSQFHQDLGLALARRRRADEGFALLILDVDHFKEINDTFGHPVGDSALREVARRLRLATRVGDSLGRLGGDEFGVILPNANDDDAVIAARRVSELLEDPIDAGGAQVRVGISTGIALCPRDGSDAESLIRKADAAMYEAKRAKAQ
jgi:diguanylate cyclase (GGDEF)-like protein/PAS domain S-box-containing protein